MAMFAEFKGAPGKMAPQRGIGTPRSALQSAKQAQFAWPQRGAQPQVITQPQQPVPQMMGPEQAQFAGPQRGARPQGPMGIQGMQGPEQAQFAWQAPQQPPTGLGQMPSRGMLRQAMQALKGLSRAPR